MDASASSTEDEDSSECSSDCDECDQLLRFLSKHPCPSQSWVETIFHSDFPSQECIELRSDLKSLHCNLDMFDYHSLEKMWKAGGHIQEKEILREVGEYLNQKGGIACMRLHFYLLSFALCGPVFIECDKPPAVKHYPRMIEMFWHNIGSWQS